jgi:VanZ family protein
VPGKKLPTTELPLDKIVHVLINAGLFFLWILYGLTISYGKNKRILVIVIATLCILYGIIIEVIQETWVPLRQADVWDLAANTVGIVLGIIVFYKMKYNFRKES